MARKLFQHVRGKKSNLPKLAPGEIAKTTDSGLEETYIGGETANIRLLDQKDKTEITAQLAEKATKTDIASMATKDYITERIVEVNTGGTVDISSKASVDYVNQSKVLFFNTLESLQAAYPNGVDNPVWVESENTWFMWEREYYTSYFTMDKDALLSTSSNWKGSLTNIKQTITLTEIGAVGLPEQWNLWEVSPEKTLSNLLASGEFTNATTNSETYYHTYKLSTPITLLAGKYYILIVKYGASGSYYLNGEVNGINDNYVDMIVGTYNNATAPTVGSAIPTTTDFVYKHYYKYEVN